MADLRESDGIIPSLGQSERTWSEAGAAVKRRRRALRISQVAFAGYANVSESTLARLERGGRVGTTSLRKIEDAMTEYEQFLAKAAA